MAIFLIPRVNDFQRLHQAGTNRLGPVMERWGNDVGIPVKDLLPDMEARSNGDFRSYFLSCDGHWSARGSTVAADILEPWLGEKKVKQAMRAWCSSRRMSRRRACSCLLFTWWEENR
jgi:hypothetical protein